MFGPGRTCASLEPVHETLAVHPAVRNTACRMLAFWPPPNDVDEIAAKASAMLAE